MAIEKDNVLVFGVEKSSFLVPSLIEGHKATKDNEVLADETLKNKGFKIGDTLSLSQSDEKLHIVGFTESAKYNASSVIFTNDATIAKINPEIDLEMRRCSCCSPYRLEKRKN